MADSNNPFGSTVTKGNPATSQTPPTSDSQAVSVRDNKSSSSLLDFLPSSQVANLPEETREALVNALDDGGFYSMTPMLCKGDQCPIYAKCPLVRNGIPVPYGADCPVETAQMVTQHQRLIDSMPAEDLQDPFTMMLIQDLEIVSLILGRATTQFAVDGGTVEKKYTVGYGPSGQPLENTAIHNALPVIEKYGKRRREIMAKLLATPMDRARAEREGMHDKSRQSAELQQKIDTLIKERMEQTGPPILEAQFTVKEEEEPAE